MHFVPFPARSERPATPEIDAARAGAELIDYDQWTVAGEFDYDRPLFRYDLNDDAGTEVYVSSRSGKVVLTTTRGARVANYLGSIPHWIYPTPLRHHAAGLARADVVAVAARHDRRGDRRHHRRREARRRASATRRGPIRACRPGITRWA